MIEASYFLSLDFLNEKAMSISASSATAKTSQLLPGILIKNSERHPKAIPAKSHRFDFMLFMVALSLFIFL